MHPPTVVGRFDDLPLDPDERHEAFVALLGQQLFSLRNQRLAAIRRLVESPEARGRVGTIHRRPYETAGDLDPAGREAALVLARTAVDLFLQDLLRLLQNIGHDARLGEDHALRYKLYLEVVSLAEAEAPVVAEDLMNRGGNRALESYFGHWLNVYASHE